MVSRPARPHPIDAPGTEERSWAAWPWLSTLEFCAIRSYLATAARHGISALDALTRAFQGNPWKPETG